MSGAALGFRVLGRLAEREVLRVAGLRLVRRRVGLRGVEAAGRRVDHLELQVVEPDRGLGRAVAKPGDVEPDGAEDAGRGQVGRRDLVARPFGREVHDPGVVGELRLELDAGLGRLRPEGEDRAPALLRGRVPGEEVEAADERPDAQPERLLPGVPLGRVDHEALEVLLLVVLDRDLRHLAVVSVAVVQRHAVAVELEAGVRDQVRAVLSLERVDRDAAHLEGALEVLDAERGPVRDAVEADRLLRRGRRVVVAQDAVEEEGVAHHRLADLAALEADGHWLALLEVGDPGVGAARRLVGHRLVEGHPVAVAADAERAVVAGHDRPVVVAVLRILDLAPRGVNHDLGLGRELVRQLALPLNAVAGAAARDAHRAILHLDVLLRVPAEAPALGEDLGLGEVVLEDRDREVGDRPARRAGGFTGGGILLLELRPRLERHVGRARVELPRNRLVEAGYAVLHDRDEARERLSVPVERRPVEREVVAGVGLHRPVVAGHPEERDRDLAGRGALALELHVEAAPGDVPAVVDDRHAAADDGVVHLLEAAVDPLLAALPPEARERLVRLGLVPAERELEEVAETFGVLSILLAEEDRRVLRVVELPAEDLVERPVEADVHPERRPGLRHEVGLHAAAVRGLDVFDAVVIVRGGGGHGGGGGQGGDHLIGCACRLLVKFNLDNV